MRFEDIVVLGLAGALGLFLWQQSQPKNTVATVPPTSAPGSTPTFSGSPTVNYVPVAVVPPGPVMSSPLQGQPCGAGTMDSPRGQYDAAGQCAGMLVTGIVGQ